jgi:ABC-type multidrug transport system ATPase subunit
MIEVRNVSKTMGSQKILSDVSLSLEPGRIVCLLGPNGSGKTTLIRTMIGLVKPTSGSIRLLGLDPWVDGSAVRARCGVVQEDDLFYDDETALSNLLLWACLDGTPRRQAIPRIEEFSSRFEIEEELDEKVATYSKGMKRRLSLVRALMKETEVLLLDEPTSGLDINARTELRGIITERVRSGRCGAVVSSHELDEVRRLEPLVKILVRGEIAAEVRSGNADEIEAKYLAALKKAGIDIAEPRPAAPLA